MRHPKLGLAKRIQLVLVGPFGRKEDTGPHDNALQMAFDRDRPSLSESERAERGVIPAVFVIDCSGYPLREPPSASHVETVCSRFLSDVSPTPINLQALSLRSIRQQEN